MGAFPDRRRQHHHDAGLCDSETDIHPRPARETEQDGRPSWSAELEPPPAGSQARGAQSTSTEKAAARAEFCPQPAGGGIDGASSRPWRRRPRLQPPARSGHMTLAARSGKGGGVVGPPGDSSLAPSWHSRACPKPRHNSHLLRFSRERPALQSPPTSSPSPRQPPSRSRHNEQAHQEGRRDVSPPPLSFMPETLCTVG